MVIDYEKYPALHFLKKGFIDSIRLSENDTEDEFYKFDELMVREFKENCQLFKTKVQVITMPFHETALKSANKFYTSGIFDEVIQETNAGVFIVNKFVVFYKIDFNNPLIIMFTDNYPVGYLSKNHSWSSSIIGKHQMGVVLMETIINITLSKYATPEIKLLPPKTKSKIFGCKYLNTSYEDVQILNIAWFTDLIQSDGFNVRGHLRLQPFKKDGKWTRELIWINEFGKHGYTRKAGILNNN